MPTETAPHKTTRGISPFRGLWLFILITASSLWFCSAWELRNYVPFADDYDTVIQFCSQWVQGGSFSLLLADHNEHPHLFVKAVGIFSLWIYGYASLDFFIAVSIAITIITLFFLVLILKRRPSNSWYEEILLPLPLIFLWYQPSYWGGLYWISAGLSHGTLVALSTVVFYLYLHKSFWWAFSLSLAAPFIAGAGLALPAGVVILFLLQHRPRIETLKSQMFFGAMLALFLSPLLLSSMSGGVVAYLADMILYTEAFIGSSILLVPLEGRILAGILITLSSYFWYRHSPLALTALLMTLAVGFGSALHRIDAGLPHAVLPRYGYYSLWMLSILYIEWLSTINRKAVLCITFLIFVSMQFFHSWQTFPARIRAFHQREAAEYILAKFEPHRVIGAYPPAEAVQHYITEAKALKVLGNLPNGKRIAQQFSTPAVIREGAPVEVTLDAAYEDTEFWVAYGGASIKADQVVRPTEVCIVPSSGGINLPTMHCAVPWGVPGHSSSEMTFLAVIPKVTLPLGPAALQFSLRGQKDWHSSGSITHMQIE